MNKGDAVTIYQKPLTDEDFEGDALLVRKYSDVNNHECLELWSVEFIEEPGEHYTRWIKVSA